MQIQSRNGRHVYGMLSRDPCVTECLKRLRWAAGAGNSRTSALNKRMANCGEPSAAEPLSRAPPASIWRKAPSRIGPRSKGSGIEMRSRIVRHSLGAPTCIHLPEQLTQPAGEPMLWQFIIDEHSQQRAAIARRKRES